MKIENDRILLGEDGMLNAASFASAVREARVRGIRTLALENRTYTIEGSDCVMRELSGINNIEPGTKRFFLYLENEDGLVFDGNGAELVFNDILFPFALFSCSNITLKNFTIDFSFPRFCQGRVVSSDEDGFVLDIDRSHYSVETDKAGHFIFHGGNSTFSTETGVVLLANAVFGKSPWDFIYAGDTSYERTNHDAACIEGDAAETDAGFRFTYREQSRRLLFSAGDTLILNYEPRANADILAFGCENIMLENIRIYRGGGMGIVVSDTENFRASHVAVKVKPGRDECRSTTADGMFFTQCAGVVEVKNCEISETLDDALNIHGFYSLISEIGENCVIAAAGRAEQAGFSICRAGDKLTVSDGETHRVRGSHRVKAVSGLPDGRVRIELTDDLSELRIGDYLENDDRAADFIFENNLIFGCPHFRVSDNGKIRIRHNTFSCINAVLIIDLISYWYETGAVSDMCIEDNKFLFCPRAGGAYPIQICSTRKNTTDVLHENITVRGNRFLSSNGHALIASSVRNLKIENNVFDGGEADSMLALDKNITASISGNRYQR